MDRDKSYKSIKELVFEMVRRTAGLIDFKSLTTEVHKAFPRSRWSKTHWAWYRNQIKNGRFRTLFSEEIRDNLRVSVEQSQHVVSDKRVKKGA